MLAGVLAFLGSSSSWIRISYIQIHGLDYWFGFITALSAIAVSVTGYCAFRQPPISQTLLKRLTSISLLLSVISCAILLVIAARVDEIAKQIAQKAEFPDSFLGGLMLGVLGKIIGKATKAVSELIQPKLAEGFYITLYSFVIAAVCSLILIFKFDPKKPILRVQD
jgi:hypothetical protein